MLTIKKIIVFSALLLTYSLLSMNSNVYAAEKEYLIQEQFISQIESLFQEDVETLNYDKIVELGNKIIIQREMYPNETLAKTYLLLANVASNKGELETAFQFIQDGIAVTTQHEKTNLYLQIKLASIHADKNQPNALLASAQHALDMNKNQADTLQFLLALSYRSIAFSMLNQHKNALIDLHKVKSIIKQDPSLSDEIALLAVLANAFYYLGDYQYALTVQLKILKLRFNLNKLDNVEQTYYHLANAYYRLNRFDDAYNAYYEAKRYAEKKKVPIYVAYASQGLGLTLFQQKQYIEAEAKILEAKALFYRHNLAKSYLETLIILVQISNAMEKKNSTINLLLEAEKLTQSIALTDDYIILYQILAKTYMLDKNLNRAYFWQQRYSAALLKMNKSTTFDYHLSDINIANTDKFANIVTDKKSRQFPTQFTDKDKLTVNISKRNQQQQTIIFVLSIMSILLLSLVVFLWLKHRVKKLESSYEAIEIPNNIVTCPIQTELLYQKNLNMAKKYSYPLTLGYISISNWQELAFKFNKKVVAEVTSEIANLISEHISEFDNAGLINDGEYLLLFPYQDKAEVEIAMGEILSVLKLRFFANLGKFSVIIAYSIESPNLQEIDPYNFLSQLSDSMKIA